MSYPSTRPVPGQSPPPGETECLTATCPAQGARGKPVLLTGCFRLRRASVASLGCAPHRALTVVVIPGVHANAAGVCLPFAAVTLFEDDLMIHGDTVIGFFQVDLAAYERFDFSEEYYIGISLGTLTAPVLRID